MKRTQGMVVILSIVLAIVAPIRASPSIVEVTQPDISPYHEVAHVLQDDYGRQTLIDIVQAEVNSQRGIVQSSYAEQSCKACAVENTKALMASAMEKVNDFCKTTECPVMRRICKVAQDWPQVTIGFMIHEVKPLVIALSFCKGSGSCSNHEVVQAMENAPTFFDDVTNSGLEYGSVVMSSPRGIDQAVRSVGKMEQTLSPLMVQKNQRISSSHDVTESEMTHCSCNPRTVGCCRCKACVVGSTELLMDVVIRHLSEYCRRTSEDSALVYCRFAKQHMEMTYGYLLSYVQPWKFALGYCYGSGECAEDSATPSRLSTYHSLYQIPSAQMYSPLPTQRNSVFHIGEEQVIVQRQQREGQNQLRHVRGSSVQSIRDDMRVNQQVREHIQELLSQNEQISQQIQHIQRMSNRFPFSRYEQNEESRFSNNYPSDELRQSQMQYVSGSPVSYGEVEIPLQSRVDPIYRHVGRTQSNDWMVAQDVKTSQEIQNKIEELGQRSRVIEHQLKDIQAQQIGEVDIFGNEVNPRNIQVELVIRQLVQQQNQIQKEVQELVRLRQLGVEKITVPEVNAVQVEQSMAHVGSPNTVQSIYQ